MKILFIVTSSQMGFWLAELTRPYWHFTERGYDVEFASPLGGKVVFDKLSNPNLDGTWEPKDLVSKGFLFDTKVAARLETTIALDKVDPSGYDAVHVVGGTGAAVDLYPNDQVARILEDFFVKGKVVGAICHGAIALANNPSRIAGKHGTGFSTEEDLQAEKMYGKGFIPNFPQPVLEKAGMLYSCEPPWGVKAVVDGKLVTGQNQNASSEYSLALLHLLSPSPVSITA